MRSLGSTGVQVSPLCLGAMMFGPRGNADHADAVRIIHHALDSGINFVDTADVYSAGESETIVGKALAGGRRDAALTLSAGGVSGDVGLTGVGHFAPQLLATPAAITTSCVPLITACAANWIACWDEPHCRSMVTAGTDCGSDEASTALRPTWKLCSPAWPTPS